MAEPLGILVAEDLPDDILILQKAFSKAGVTAPLHFVRDGQEAIDYLKGEQAFVDRTKHPFPGLLLLDLKMPRLDGFGVLEWVRGQQKLRRLPVVMFTSSEQPADVNRAYDLGANSFLLKPVCFTEYQETARTLENYWLKINRRADFVPERAAGIAGKHFILQNLETKNYFQRPDLWTSDPRHAFRFVDLEDATARAQELQLKDVHVLLAKEEADKSIRVQGGIRL